MGRPGLRTMGAKELNIGGGDGDSMIELSGKKQSCKHGAVELPTGMRVHKNQSRKHESTKEQKRERRKTWRRLLPLFFSCFCTFVFFRDCFFSTSVCAGASAAWCFADSFQTRRAPAIAFYNDIVTE